MHKCLYDVLGMYIVIAAILHPRSLSLGRDDGRLSK